MTKSAFQSKTVWSNIALTSLAFVLSPDTPIIGEFVKDPATLALIFGVANVALRFVSKGPISIRPA